jgi:hypothetical protein
MSNGMKIATPPWSSQGRFKQRKPAMQGQPYMNPFADDPDNDDEAEEMSPRSPATRVQALAKKAKSPMKTRAKGSFPDKVKKIAVPSKASRPMKGSPYKPNTAGKPSAPGLMFGGGGGTVMRP